MHIYHSALVWSQHVCHSNVLPVNSVLGKVSGRNRQRLGCLYSIQFTRWCGIGVFVAFSPEHLIAASHGTVVIFWKPRQECVSYFDGHNSRVCSVAFSPDDVLVASGSDTRQSNLGSANGGLVKHWRITYWVCSVAFHPLEPLFLRGRRSTVRIWNLPSGDAVAF